MRARVIVIVSIGREHAAQVVFAHNYDVVQALAAKRANQPFGHPVLPW